MNRDTVDLFLTYVSAARVKVLDANPLSLRLRCRYRLCCQGYLNGLWLVRSLDAKQNGTLIEQRGRSARSFLSNWRYALDHFELTRQLLAEIPVHTRVEDMQSQSFFDFVANHENLWLFCSNVLLFVFFDLRFQCPQNAVLFASLLRRDGDARPGWHGERTGDGPLPDSHVRFELERF